MNNQRPITPNQAAYPVKSRKGFPLGLAITMERIAEFLLLALFGYGLILSN